MASVGSMSECKHESKSEKDGEEGKLFTPSNPVLKRIHPTLKEAIAQLLKKVEKGGFLEEDDVVLNDRCGEPFDPLLYIARYLHRHNPSQQQQYFKK